jgi:ethanolamine utilization protein EutA
VGTILKQEFGLNNDVLCIDGITLRDFDFIDLGAVLEPSGTVPVTIKSLVFQL